MPRRREPELQRSKVISVRFHPNEDQQVRALARQRGQYLSDYIRSCCTHAPPPAVPSLPVIPFQMLAEVRELHAKASIVHQRAMGWKGHFAGHRRVRFSRADFNDMLDDLLQHVEQLTAQVSRVLVEAGVTSMRP